MVEGKLNKDKTILVIRKGEMIVETIKGWCQKEGITSGLIQGIGAVDRAEIAHYNVETKKYTPMVLKEALEMVTLTGNVFRDEKGELVIHLHVGLGRANGELMGGHLVEARVGGVGEIIIEAVSSELIKKYDNETGLKILSES